MIVGIGICCWLFAVGLLAVDQIDFDPDPFLQAIVFAVFGIACFIAEWRVVHYNRNVTAYFYEQLASHEDASAMYRLADMYVKGKGVPKSLVLGYMWLSLAAERGTVDGGAATARDSLAAKMTPDEMREAQRLAREWQPIHGPSFVELRSGW